MEHWEMSYQLNSDSCHPLEYGGYMSSSILNKTRNKMLVTEVGLAFDWKGVFSKNCNIEIAPGAKMDLPRIPFQVDLEVGLATHEYKAGVTYMLLTKTNWKAQGDGIKWCKTCKHMIVEKSEERNFEVFISHSNAPDDAPLLKKTTDSFTNCGIKTYVAERTPQPGYPLWQKIESAIRRADAILILWTQAGSRSGDIREEIGIAVGAQRTKRIIPIVETHLKTKGSLVGLEHIPLKMGNELEALSTAISRAIEWADEKGKTNVT
jgi:hypothetical protein